MDEEEERLIIEKEKESQENEINWLLEVEIPRSHQYIESLLQQTLQVLSSSEELLSFKKEREKPTGGTEPKISGNMSIEGWMVTDAEFSGQIGRFQPFRTSINKNSPFRIVQIHNAHNYVRLALEGLSQFQQVKDQERSIQLQNFAKVLYQTSICIIKAKQQLAVVPDNLATGTEKYFVNQHCQPLLPIDYSIEITLQDATASIKVFALVHNQKSLRRESSTVLTQFLGGGGESPTHRGVMDHETVTCYIPFVEKAISICSKAYQECCDVRSKISALEFC